MHQKKKGLTLTDIMVTIVIAIVFGIIYKLWGPFSDVVKPLGFRADQLVYGMWFIAAIVAFLIIRKPGVALIAEVAAAQFSVLIGSEWGLSTLVYGLVQGLGAEMAFACFRYRHFSVWVASLAAIGSAAGSLILDIYYEYITDLALWNLLLLIGARVIGSIVIAGIFAYYLVKALEATKVTNLVRPPTSEDYKTLDQ